MEEEPNLPTGWVVCFDETYNTPYYLHEESGHSQWEHPLTHTHQEPVPESLHVDTDEKGVENEEIRAEVRHSPYQGYSLPIDSYRDQEAHTEEDPYQPQPPLFTKSGYYGPTEVEWYEPEELLEEPDIPSSEPALSQPSYHSASAYSLPVDAKDGQENMNNTPPKKRKERMLLARGSTQHDYENMARMYRLQRPYSDPHYAALCLLCRKNYAQDVFFPCEHHCVCRECLEREHICEERLFNRVPDAYINCSLCAGIIKRIFPLEDGMEVEKYWAWVLEEKPPLPREFMRNFKHSGAVIRAVYITDEFKQAHGLNKSGRRDGEIDELGEGIEDASKLCAIS